MYYNRKKLIISIIWIILGAAFLIAEITRITDNPLFGGIGGGWLAIGIMQTVKNLRYNSNEEYREKVDTELQDERNRYIRMKAWSWAGYIFVIASAIFSLVMFVMKQTLIAQTISLGMCVVLSLFWFSYIYLQKKY